LGKRVNAKSTSPLEEKGALCFDFISGQSDPGPVAEVVKRKSSDPVKFIRKLFIVHPVYF
jgi:hypothetical protein